MKPPFDDVIQRITDEQDEQLTKEERDAAEAAEARANSSAEDTRRLHPVYRQ